MFAKGQRVITPFGVGEVKSVTDSSCVVELASGNNSARRIGTFMKSKLKVCSITSPIASPVPIAPEPEQPSPETNSSALEETPIASEPKPELTKPKKKRGIQTQS